MKILILTEGGRAIGFGHITRCIALCEALEEKSVYPQLIVNGDVSVLNLLRRKNFYRFDWIMEKEKLFKILANSNFIIIDSYLAEKPLFDRISEITDGRVLIIDDCNRINYPKSIVVNPSIYGDKLNYSRKNNIVYLLGKDYTILRKEFWNVPEKKINKKIKNILITFGGINNYDLLKKIVNFLKVKFNFNFYIVDPRKSRLTAKEMLNLMLKSDVCISGGGQTTYELARVGVPTIGVCFAENQRLNLESWHNKGFIEYVEWYNEKNLLKKMFLAIRNLADYKDRIKKSKIGKNCIDGNGVERILSKMI